MPKMKTKKSVAKKVKLTGTGQLLHRKAGKRKALSFKSSARKRRLSRHSSYADGRVKTIKRLAQVG